MRNCRLEVGSEIFDHGPFFRMSGAAKLDVPLVAEPGVGMNWEEAH